MSTEKDYLKSLLLALKPILQEFGFKKSGLNWYVEGKSTVKIFNIQKSAFGQQIYLNIGVKVRTAKQKTSFTIPGCAVTTRLDSLIDKQALDFEKPMNPAKRIELFETLIRRDPYGFFTLLDNKLAILKFISAAKLENQITTKGREYLGLPL